MVSIENWAFDPPAWLMALAVFAQLVIIAGLIRASMKLRDLNTLIRNNQALWLETLREIRKQLRLTADASHGLGEELRLAMRNYPVALRVIMWLTCRKPAAS